MTIVVFTTYAVYFLKQASKNSYFVFQLLNLLLALHEYKYYSFQKNYSCFIIMQQKPGWFMYQNQELYLIEQ